MTLNLDPIPEEDKIYMTHEEFMELPIANVQEIVEQRPRGQAIFILFTLDSRPMYIDVYAYAEHALVFRPNAAYHRDKSKACHFCGITGKYGCYTIREHLPALFERLIASNSIRLSWIYRKYGFKQQYRTKKESSQ